MAFYRRTYIRNALDRAEAEGIIHSWQLQGDMPGLRWTVEWKAPLSTRAYSTAEAGAVADALTCSRESVRSRARL